MKKSILFPPLPLFLAFVLYPHICFSIEPGLYSTEALMALCSQLDNKVEECKRSIKDLEGRRGEVPAGYMKRRINGIENLETKVKKGIE